MTDAGLSPSLFDLSNRLSQALTYRNRNDYDIGWLIDDVVRSQGWLKWPAEQGGPYRTFEDWCWGFLHFGHHKAKKLASNYLNLRALTGLAPDTLSRALRLGWTKLAYILRVARTEAALTQWLDYVEDKKITKLDLRVATALSATVSGTPPRGDVQPPEQIKPARKRKIRWTLTFEDDEALAIFQKALNVVKSRLPDIGDGRAAALIATHYMALCARDDEGGVAVELETVLEALEKTYRVQLGVVEKAPPKPTRGDEAADL